MTLHNIDNEEIKLVPAKEIFNEKIAGENNYVLDPLQDVPASWEPDDNLILRHSRN